jgi:hypothetical protein
LQTIEKEILMGKYHMNRKQRRAGMKPQPRPEELNTPKEDLKVYDSERELPDDYPLYAGYLYIVDGRVVQAIENGTPAQWKRVRGVNSIKNCDIDARDLWHLAL